MNKTLFHLNGTDFPQSEFAYYIQRCPFSTKSYAGDFMQEVYDLFIRDIVTTAERKNLTTKHPEFDLLMKEYREQADGPASQGGSRVDRTAEPEIPGDDKLEAGEESE